MKNNKSIIFCDFDDTLVHDKCWRSLPFEEKEKMEELLFRNDRTVFNEWLRGKHTAEDVNQYVSEKTGIPYDRLWKVFVEDCRTIRINKSELEMLNTLRERYTVILLTGNMDSFSRFTVPALSLEKYFDKISNSFYEKLHKTDNEGELFLKYAKKYGVNIEDCISIDDSEKVATIFEKLGGRVYRVTKEKPLALHLEELQK